MIKINRNRSSVLLPSSTESEESSMTTTRPARTYGRFSSQPQERSDSFRRQTEGAKSFAERYGFTIIGEPFFDEGISGKAGKNLEKEFGRLLREAKVGETILCEAVDRIGRQHPIEVLTIIKDRIVEKGLSIVFWQKGLTVDASNIGNPSILFSLFGETTVGYSDNSRKMERLQEVAKESYEQGARGIMTGALSRYLPRCYKWNEALRKTEIVEERAEVIRTIFKEFNSGIGRTTICKRFNDQGVPTITKCKEGSSRKGWIETSISKVLRNESYTGILTVKGQRFDCGLTPVVKKETFDKAQMLLKRYEKRCGNLRDRINNIFAGIGKCASCGAAMIVLVSNGRGNAKTCYSYRCSNSRLGTCDNKKMRNARILELVFFAAYFGGSPNAIFTKESAALKENLAVMEAKSKRIKDAISNLYDMAESGDKEAKDRIATRRRELAANEKEISLLKASMVEDAELPTLLDEIDSLIGTPEGNKALEDFYPKLEAVLADNETRKKLVAALPSIFEKVIFHNNNFTIQAVMKDGRKLELQHCDNFEEVSFKVA